MINRRKEGGFTLIELMIVIAVIGILAVVLVPKMAGVKTSAKNVGVETNVKSVQVYVTANLDRWITGNKTEEAIAEEIYAQFNATDNELQNPFSGSKTISSTVTNANTDSATLATTDALQIISSTTALSDTDASSKGAVVVNIDSYDSSGIQIAGYDNGTKIVDSVFLIKP